MSKVLTEDALRDTRLSLAAVEPSVNRVYEIDVRHLLRTLDRAACHLAAGEHENAYVLHRIVVMGMSCLH